MTAKEKESAERCVAESRRLLPPRNGNLSDGGLHLIINDDDCLVWADTVGSGTVDLSRAGDLADELAELDAVDPDDEGGAADLYEVTNEIVDRYLIRETCSW